MSTLSTGVVARIEDDNYMNINGTVPDFGNRQWDRSGGGSRESIWGIVDLKAADIQLPAAHFRFTNMSPEIPPNAIILSADISGGAGPFSTFDNGPLTSVISLLDRDGLWDAIPDTGAQWVSADHPTFPIQHQVDVRNAADSTLGASPAIVGLEKFWPLRRYSSPARTSQLGQVITIVSADTLDNVNFKMNRVGTPTGDVFLEVYALSATLPATLLATSDLVDTSTISTSGFPSDLVNFVFTGGDAIALSTGQLAFVARGNWTITGSDYLRLSYDNASYVGYPVTFGEGVGLDDQNYPVAQMPLDVATIGGTVTWITPNFDPEDDVFTSPDLSVLLQAYVDSALYAQSDPFCIRMARLGTAQKKQRTWKAFDHPDTPGVVQNVTLAVEWDDPVALPSNENPTSTTVCLSPVGSSVLTSPSGVAAKPLSVKEAEALELSASFAVAKPESVSGSKASSESANSSRAKSESVEQSRAISPTGTKASK